MKALFFDIDGTLVSFRTHEIPASTVSALRRAKEKGHGVFISTGRPRTLIDNIGAIEDLIDGYVTTNGSYCFVGDVVTTCRPIAPEDVRAVISMADAYDFPCMIVGEKETAVYRENQYVNHLLAEVLNVRNLHNDRCFDELLSGNVLQLSPFIAPDRDAELKSRLRNSVSMRWCPYFSDVFSSRADKAEGIRSVAAHLGLDCREVIAFGDGENDIPMLRFAGIGIAMGNSDDTVKSAADIVTASVDEDGVEKALLQLGLID